jgi:phage tail protein X
VKRCMQALRFVVGLAMLVGGVAVLAPLAGDVLAHRSPPILQSEEPVSTQGMPHVAIGHAIPDPRAGMGMLSESQFRAADVDGGALMLAPSPPPAPVYQPPTPPSLLPAGPQAMARPAPSLDSMYRSTLAMPPPPLLDAHGPPPLAPGWTARGLQQPIQASPSHGPAVPATYAVRDGDDLTSVAIRFYGHPAAAAAILAANSDRLADPDVLPIGVRLRLPPPWTVTAGRTSAESRSIEPGPGIDRGPTATPTGLQPRPMPSSQPWLKQHMPDQS